MCYLGNNSRSNLNAKGYKTSQQECTHRANIHMKKNSTREKLIIGTIKT